jgi:hypothetical protein
VLRAACASLVSNDHSSMSRLYRIDGAANQFQSLGRV